MKTLPKRYIGLKSKQWYQIGVFGSCLFNAFGIYMVTNSFIQTHDFKSPVVIKFEVKTQTPVTEKKTKLIKPISYGFQKVYAAEVVKAPETWEDVIKAAEKVAGIYNYPVNVMMAQAALESARGTSYLSRTRHNYLGINAIDSDPNQAYYYENAEQCFIDYIRVIQTNFPEAWASRENPAQLLRLLKVNSNNNYYASDPDYVSKVMSMKEYSL